jgi:hypothetical protein
LELFRKLYGYGSILLQQKKFISKEEGAGEKWRAGLSHGEPTANPWRIGRVPPVALSPSL